VESRLGSSASPTHEKQVAFKQFLADYVRANRVGYTIERTGTMFCPGQMRYAGGVVLATAKVAPPDLEATARALIGPLPIVYTVVAGSPAEQAGVRPGDLVVSINGREAQASRGPNGQAERSETWVVERGGQQQSLHFEGAPICNFPVHVAPSQQFAAESDGRHIVISTHAVEFASDDELALVIGHEMAHIVMGHFDRAGRVVPIVHTTLPGGLPDASYATEAEADYVGEYLAAGAGYDIRKAAELWSRIGTAEPGQAHPPSRERLARALATASEIERKRDAGLEILPSGLQRVAALTP
jgi:hypothetical protein